MSNIHDVCIVGLGVSGAWAAYKIAKDFPHLTAIGIDFGRPPMKRRQQISGWLGLLPNSDGKFFLNDMKLVSNITTSTRTKSAAKQVKALLKNFSSCKVIKDDGPSITVKKKINKAGYKVQLNDFFQLYPKDIHALSKMMSEEIEQVGNVTFSFDNEVQSITKQKNIFVVQTELQDFKCRKIIFCVGRGGWREARNIFNNFGLIEDNNTARFGVRVEMPANILKDFNKSNCRIFNSEIDIGPLSWNGTVIPEDATEATISSFRSNENRWKSDKVSFQFIGNIHAPNKGFEETNRIANLTFVLADNRVIKEKISSIINKKNKIISIIPEYNWLSSSLQDFAQIVPEILTKAYFHIPTVIPLAPSINLGNNLESEVDGMFIAGESAGIQGLYAAAMMGIISATAACKTVKSSKLKRSK